MGIMDMVSSVAGQFGGGGDKAKVAGGFLEEMAQRPGGMSGVFSAFQQNGMGGMVQQWAGGQTQPVQPGQVEQGLGGTGIIDRVAQRTGLSTEVVKVGMAALVPVVVHHFVSNGHVTPDGQPTGQPAPEAGGLLQSVLSRLG
jgi:uncharacterized protein YidB (DUF937 family)